MKYLMHNGFEAQGNKHIILIAGVRTTLYLIKIYIKPSFKTSGIGKVKNLSHISSKKLYIYIYTYIHYIYLLLGFIIIKCEVGQVYLPPYLLGL